MTVTFEVGELSKVLSELTDWYNGMTIYVITNMMNDPHPMAFGSGRIPTNEFHRWCKKYQEDHPKPSWKDLLPD